MPIWFDSKRHWSAQFLGEWRWNDMDPVGIWRQIQIQSLISSKTVPTRCMSNIKWNSHKSLQTSGTVFLILILKRCSRWWLCESKHVNANRQQLDFLLGWCLFNQNSLHCIWYSNPGKLLHDLLNPLHFLNQTWPWIIERDFWKALTSSPTFLLQVNVVHF